MKKKFVLLMMTVLAALSLVACGEISYDKISGDWKLKSIGEKTVADYAAELEVPEVMAMVTMSVKDDDTIVSTSVDPTTLNSTVTETYKIERKSNGFDIFEKDSDEIFFHVTYDEDADTLSYSFNLGSGELTYVFEKGTYDFNTALAAVEETADPEGTEDAEGDGNEEDASVDTEDGTDSSGEADGDSKEDADDEDDTDEEIEPIEVTVENVRSVLTGYTWVDENGVEVTFYDDGTSYVISAGGSAMEAEWQVVEMEDGSVALINYIDGNENIQTIVSCNQKTLSCDDGTIYTYVEE